MTTDQKTYTRRAIAFGCRLRRTRAARNFTAEEMAAAARYSTGLIWIIEKGIHFPDYAQRERIGRAIGVDLHALAMEVCG